ncbi:MAG: hypothetical protein OWQ55_06955 [Sulfuracidifex metallicus]|nr:hypothetical protein [Sulfuracidifex metallicus]
MEEIKKPNFAERTKKKVKGENKQNNNNNNKKIIMWSIHSLPNPTDKAMKMMFKL